MIRAVFLACLLFAAPPARADAPPGDAPDAAPAEEAAIEWREPILYSLTGMGVGIVALVATRQADDDPRFSNFKSAFSSGPRRDDDSALYNLVLHPLWGSETYLRAREANMGVAGSFAFSLGASVAWEYLVESWTEHPSTQDLILTTGIGWILGEARHQLKQRMPEESRIWVDPIHEGLGRLGLGFESSKSRGQRVRLSFQF